MPRRRSRVLLVALAACVVAVAAGCSKGANPEFSNTFGDCTFEPHAVCAGQDLSGISVVASDLTGADFTGSSLKGADLRDTILRNAKLVDVDLSNADLSGADLRGADLGQARVFNTTFEGADWAGADRSGLDVCQTILPAGTVSDCPDFDQARKLAAQIDYTPPSVVRFAPHRPFVCHIDAIGEGVEVDWRVADTTSVAFLVDGARVSETAEGKRGVQRIPVICDGKSHRFTIQAFGVTPPLASQSFTRTVSEGTLDEPIR